MPLQPTPWSDVVDPLSLHHARARCLLESGAPVFLCVNPVEYHGPHLSLHNDALLSRGLAALLHAAWAAEADLPFVATADLEVGVEPVPGPGTVDRPFVEVRDRVVAACLSLADVGARRVVLTTFHGAPMHQHALQAGVKALAARGIPAYAPMVTLLRELLGFTADALEDVWALVPDAADRQALRAGVACDFHGGFMETSLALAIAPESVSDLLDQTPDCPDFPPDGTMLALAARAEKRGRVALAQELRMAAWGRAWAALDPFPGYTSKPRLATAEVGRTYAELLVPALVSEGRGVLREGARAPTPPMAWLRDISLGGRIKLG
jgi:creatinine amidohydrolase